VRIWQKKIEQNSIRVDIDDRNESVGKRIRESETEWIQYTLVIGEKEINSKNLHVRDRSSGDLNEMPLEDFVSEIKNQVNDKPVAKLNQEKHVSKRPQIMV